jgi:hypothetical protein
MPAFESSLAYQSLSPGEQVRFLLRFGWRLTVVARHYYVPQTEDLAVPAAVREINELQHRVLSHALSVLTGEQARYPDDVFVAIVIDNTSETNGLRSRVEAAFAETYLEFRPREPSTMMA